jgi:uncharacterized protein (TIGR02594 family)
MALTDLYASPVAAASSMVGANERDAAVADFLRTGGANLDPATQAWCAAFVNASLGHAGVQGTGAMNARSFLDWGQPVDQPQPGDVAVFSRGDPGGWQGHVGFFEGFGPGGQINVLGGNQGDSVSVAGFDPSSLLGFRRAPGDPSAARQSGGLDDLYLPPQQAQAAQEPNEQTARAEAEKLKRKALFDTLPGLYG